MHSAVPNAIVIGLVYYLTIRALTTISDSILYGPILAAYDKGPEALHALIEAGYAPDPTFFEKVLLIATSVLTVLLGFGFILYTLRISRGDSASMWTLFDGFGLFFKVLWMNIRVYLVIFLWSLLFIVPGIMASYSYRLTAFLLADHPDWSILSSKAFVSPLFALYFLQRPFNSTAFIN